MRRIFCLLPFILWSCNQTQNIKLENNYVSSTPVSPVLQGTYSSPSSIPLAVATRYSEKLDYEKIKFINDNLHMRAEKIHEDLVLDDVVNEDEIHKKEFYTGMISEKQYNEYRIDSFVKLYVLSQTLYNKILLTEPDKVNKRQKEDLEIALDAAYQGFVVYFLKNNP